MRDEFGRVEKEGGLSLAIIVNQQQSAISVGSMTNWCCYRERTLVGLIGECG